MEYLIRQLEDRDLDQLIELCREHAEYERANWTGRARTEDLREMFLTSQGARCWVVSERNRLVGFASVTLERSTWDAGHYLHLDCLYLLPSHRGRGIGRQLIQLAATTAIEWGVLNMQWQTPAWNEGAVRFYKRFGAFPAQKTRFTLSIEQCARLGGGEAVLRANE